MQKPLMSDYERLDLLLFAALAYISQPVGARQFPILPPGAYWSGESAESRANREAWWGGKRK